MATTIGISDKAFNRLSIVKNGLELSWSEYLLRLSDNTDRMVLAEHNLIKANERIAELEQKL